MQTPSVAPRLLGLNPSLVRRATLVLSVYLAVMLIAVLYHFLQSRAEGQAGYDFRYFWVAGRVWLEGLSPYGPDLPRLSAEMIPEGHVPRIWPYPPTLWLPTAFPALFPFETAWRIWLGLHGVAMILASAVIAVGLPALRISLGAGREFAVPRPLFFALHLGLMAYGEANLLSANSGQVTGLLYLGAAVMMVGLYHDRDKTAIVGLTILLMKPHIGAAVALGLLISGARGRRLVLWAAVASVVLMLPALAIAPTAIFDWLRGLARYDGENSANLPEAMTGLRNLLWEFGGLTLGNLAASLAGLAVSGVVAVWLCRKDRRGDAPLTDEGRLTRLSAAMILAALAAAPLHLYDFVLLGVALPLLPLLAPARVFAALIAILMLTRPCYLHVQVTGELPTQIFVGSTFATLGAAVLLAVLLVPAPVAGLRRPAPL